MLRSPLPAPRVMRLNARSERRFARRSTWLVPAAAFLLLLATSSDSEADERCPGELQQNVCLEAVGSCPAVPDVGLANSPWPVAGQNAQHTGQSPHNGPTCAKEVWTSKIKGKILSSFAIGEDGTLFVASAKYPICALNPANGQVYWCDTDNLGKLPDYSAPAVGNGGYIYVGTRDNDMWAIEIPPNSSTQATVAWRQKVCTDGDITVSPLIGPDGVIYMGSDSLSAGTVVAMCPGPERQVKWCINPLGGGIKNVSPALSPDNSVLYVTHGGAVLVALDPQTGQKHWEIVLETKRKGVRGQNYTPVVHPVTGKIYVGMDKGIWEVTPPPSLPGTPTAQLLFQTFDTQRERVQSPPALDLVNNSIVFLASRGQRTALYSIAFDGTLKWRKDESVLGRGRARNTPPVIDANGNIYIVLKNSMFGFTPAGNLMFSKQVKRLFFSAPILTEGRLYAGTSDGQIYAIGDCP